MGDSCLILVLTMALVGPAGVDGLHLLAYAEDTLDPQSGETVVEGGWTQETFDSRDAINPVIADNEFGVEEEQFVLDSRFRMFFKADDPETPANEGLADVRISDILALNRFVPRGLDRDRGLVSVRASRRIAGQELIDLRDSPPNRPDVERAQFVHAIEFVRPRFNGDGVQVFNPAQQPVVDPMDLIVPTDVALVSKSIRQEQGETEIGTVVALNPYALTLDLPGDLNPAIQEQIQATFTRHSDGASRQVALNETGADTNVFSGDGPDFSVLIRIFDIETFGPAGIDGIGVDVSSSILGRSFSGTKSLIETGVGSLRFRDERVAISMTAAGGLSPFALDTVRVQFTDFNGLPIDLVLAETDIDTATFSSGGVSLLLFDPDHPVETTALGQDSFVGILNVPAGGIQGEPVLLDETDVTSLVFHNDVVPDEVVVGGGAGPEVIPEIDELERVLREFHQFTVRIVAPSGGGSLSLTLDTLDDEGTVIATKQLLADPIGTALFETSKPILAVSEEPDELFSDRFGQEFGFVLDADVRARRGASSRTRSLLKIISLGDSITAGMHSLTTLEGFQRKAYPIQIAQRLGISMLFPNYPSPGRPASLWDIEKRELVVQSGPATPSGNRSRPTETIQNLAVPGVEIRHVLEDRAVIPEGRDTDRVTAGMQDEGENFTILARQIWRHTPSAPGGPTIPSPIDKSAVQQAIDQKPNLVIVWLGNNDALEGMLEGQLNGGFLTPATGTFTDFDGNIKPGYEASLTAIIDQLRSIDPKPDIMVVNVPNVTRAPIFVPVGGRFGDIFPFTFRARGRVFSADKTSYLQDSRVEQDAHPTNSVVSLLNWADELHDRIDRAGNNDLLTKNPHFRPTLVADKVIHPTVERDVVVARIESGVPASPGYNEVIERVVEAVNTGIAAQTPPGTPVLVVDMHAIFDEIIAGVTPIGGVTLNGTWKGGVFSLDGIHPSSTAHSIIADRLIRRIRLAVLDRDIPHPAGQRAGDTRFGGIPFTQWRRFVFDEWQKIIRSDPLNRDRLK